MCKKNLLHSIIVENRPTVFIRFNPDKYVDEDGNQTFLIL